MAIVEIYRGRLLDFSILSNMNRANNKIPDFFWTVQPTKCSTKPVGKILDKFTIVFEATGFERAFCSLFNTKLPDLSEVKTHATLLRSPICGTLYASLPSLRISFWALADMQAKITHALLDVRDLQTSGHCCDQSRPFRRPPDQKKRRLWERECCLSVTSFFLSFQTCF